MPKTNRLNILGAGEGTLAELKSEEKTDRERWKGKQQTFVTCRFSEISQIGIKKKAPKRNPRSGKEGLVGGTTKKGGWSGLGDGRGTIGREGGLQCQWAGKNREK